MIFNCLIDFLLFSEAEHAFVWVSMHSKHVVILSSISGEKLARTVPYVEFSVDVEWRRQRKGI